MLKSLLKSKFMIMPIAAGAAALAVAVPAAANNWGASQTGVRQGGSADAAVIQIQVEAGLPASASLLPDEPWCGGPGGGLLPGCDGVPVSVTIRNLTGQWLRLGLATQTQVNPACVPGGATFCAPAPMASDRVDTGQWQPDMVTYNISGSGANCGTYGLFLPAPVGFFGSSGNGTKALPTIPPHGSLSLPTADGRSLGTLHLSPTTPNTCQGASFRVPLTVAANPVAS